ncbi:MAG: response regulator [Trichloromonadaceae bacterium]
MGKRKRFGEILLEAKVISESALQAALEEQRGINKRLGHILEEMGVVSENDIALALARQFGFKYVQNLAKDRIPDEVLALVDSEMALKRTIFPLRRDRSTLSVAMVNPLDQDTVNIISFKTGLGVEPCVTTYQEIQAAIHLHYLSGCPNVASQESSTGWTILVVDDQQMVRSAILAALKQGGYKAVEAENGVDGLKLASQLLPHLILTDIVMPRMDGYEMFRALQSFNGTKTIPVIALSSQSDPEEESNLLDMGFFDYLPKPVNSVRLLARIKRGIKMHYSY